MDGFARGILVGIVASLPPVQAALQSGAKQIINIATSAFEKAGDINDDPIVLSEQQK